MAVAAPPRSVRPPARPRRRLRKRTRVLAGLLAVALVAAGAVATLAWFRHSGPVVASCRVASASPGSELGLDQAANATTIAAVAAREGLPDHAVTVALAAALQESRLHNLNYGDRDSLGLFQQRPSQGWGTPAQLMTPSYAAAAFYEQLTRVPGWDQMAVTDAAQRVQRSGAPTAYANWEGEARTIAIAVTGEQPGGLACRFATPKHAPLPPDYMSALTRESGVTTLAAPLAKARGWGIAAWLVGHAQQYGITSVTFDGQRWTPASGKWRSYGTPDAHVRAEQRNTT